jgi:hypothetical protein
MQTIEQMERELHSKRKQQGRVTDAQWAIKLREECYRLWCKIESLR